MEELLKAKDAQIDQLGKLKDALKTQVMKLKEQVTELIKNSEGTKAPAYPDLSPQFEASQIKLDDANQKLLKMTVEKEKLQEKVLELEKVPLTPEKLMEQLKKGMLTLGQQNFSIEEKIDQLKEKIGAGNIGVTKPSSTSSYVSSGLSQTQHTPISHTKEVKVRKPSDILHKRQDQAPKKALKPLQDSAAVPTGDKKLITLPYVEAGQSIVCPHCGEQDFGEQPDQSRILSYAPVKKYAKKYYCKSCRKEWRYE